MPTIHLTTEINAPISICFNLSRSIDLHSISTNQTKEKAIDGKVEGLICINEMVTWEATHFGIRQKLTSKITDFEAPYHFRDEQIKGIFKSIVHDHHFEEVGKTTIMTDIFVFESPFGLMGRLFNRLVLTRYMKRFLETRNQIIKAFAETEKWKTILKDEMTL